MKKTTKLLIALIPIPMWIGLRYVLIWAEQIDTTTASGVWLNMNVVLYVAVFTVSVLAGIFCLISIIEDTINKK